MALWVMAYAYAFASAALACFYAFLSAEGTAAFVKAAILGLVAFGCSHGLAWGRDIYLRRGFFAGMVVYVATAFGFVVTLAGGIGTLSVGSSSVSAERERTAATASIDRARLKRLKEERAPMKARAEGAVRAELLSSRSQNAYKVSNGCEPEHITAPATRAFCETYRKLEAELETAKEIARLDRDIGSVEERIRNAPPEVKPDPQAAALSVLLGVSTEFAQAGYALLASIALELLSAAAMMRASLQREVPPVPEAPKGDIPTRDVIHKVEPKISDVDLTRISVSAVSDALPARQTLNDLPQLRSPNPSKAPRKAPVVFGSVRRFLERELISAEGDRISVRAVFSRYNEWCKEASTQPASLTRFFETLEAHCRDNGSTIEWEGKEAYCAGMSLAGQIAA